MQTTKQISQTNVAITGILKPSTHATEVPLINYQ